MLDFRSCNIELRLKAALKNIITRSGLGWRLHQLLYAAARLRQLPANRRFKHLHPEIILPPDRWLFETIAADHRKFWDDGLLAATEIRDWMHPYLSENENHILDWGCGVARISRHLPAVWPGQFFYGCDTNQEMIEWNKQHCAGIQFFSIPHDPPTEFNTGQFQFVFGFSVLTHIDVPMQVEWIKEMHRVLAPGGILMVTTHGNAFVNNLTAGEKNILADQGVVSQPSVLRGHRMQATYNDASVFRKMISAWFNVLEYFDGQTSSMKAGSQDLWILKKSL